MTRDDRILPAMRWLITPLAILSTIFGPILYFLPDRTDTLFAWTIVPPMSAVFIGASYIFGGLTIWHLLRNGRWHPMRVSLPGTLAFGTAMLGATLLHLDRFHHGSILFYGWFAVYVVTPILLPAVYLRNQRRDPGPQPGDLLVPRAVRAVLLAVGIGYSALGVGLFVVPEAFASIWPWQLTPLVGRVIGGWLLLFGVGAALAWIEPRWTAFRTLVQDAMVWLALLLIGSLLHTGDFDFSRPMTIVWFVGIAGALVGTAAYYLWNERLRRAAATVTPAEA